MAEETNEKTRADEFARLIREQNEALEAFLSGPAKGSVINKGNVVNLDPRLGEGLLEVEAARVFGRERESDLDKCIAATRAIRGK